MTTRDYVAWHEEYGQPGSRLHMRLLVVQDLISRALDELPPGPVRFISMCAGQGADILTVARRHRRGRDLQGLLVELDPTNAARARATIAQAGLTGVEVVEADAGASSDVYAAAVPAHLVLACGVFGNITDDDIANTVAFLPALCAPGAWVVWTRYPRDDDIIATVEDWFADAGFEPRALVVPEHLAFGVGAAQLGVAPAPFRSGARLFSFIR